MAGAGNVVQDLSCVAWNCNRKKGGFSQVHSPSKKGLGTSLQAVLYLCKCGADTGN